MFCCMCWQLKEALNHAYDWLVHVAVAAGQKQPLKIAKDWNFGSWAGQVYISTVRINEIEDAMN